jgi:hypothetical protein
MTWILFTEISNLYVTCPSVSSLLVAFILIIIQENVIVDKRGVACIADFGQFKIMDFFDFSLRSAAVYTAPELSALLELPRRTIAGHSPEPTKMSDVYSLGLLTVEV